MRWGSRARPQLRCRTVARLVQAYLDGALADPRAVLVADHLDLCLECGLDARTWQWLKERISAVGRPDDPEQVARLRSFVDALVDHSAPPG